MKLELLQSSKLWRYYWGLFLCLLASLVEGLNDVKLLTRADISSSLEVFSQPYAVSFGQLLPDIQKYQLIVGARDYLFRLSLEGLTKLEEVYSPADVKKIETCQLKGKSEADCRNYIKVLVKYGDKLFSCGTNAFSPECSYRQIDSLKSVIEKLDGTAQCPYSPHANSTALMLADGDYYIASTIDFSELDPVILKVMGRPPHARMRTVQYEHKWLNDANFIASYEIENFVYFFFREAASEYINCGKAVYSRVARVCKNDQGGKFQLKDKFTTFLKARINCSIPGNYPFYYNEIQSVHYLEREEIFYATFTTPPNSIYGTAICAFNLSAISSSFSGSFKYQENPKSAWESHTSPSKHFQCGASQSEEHILDSDRYQLMNDAVQPMTSYPILQLENERFHHIVVDTVRTKHFDRVHVLFVSSGRGLIRKIVEIPDTKQTCMIEKIQIFPDGSDDEIKTIKLLPDTNSLYIGTEESVLRILTFRCSKYITKSECLSSMDPYCGWDVYKMQCTTAPHRNPESTFWEQEKISCPRSDMAVNGGWSLWSPWFECSQTGENVLGDRCMCQRRACDNPAPANGGEDCKGTAVHVANCTRDGQYTEWSSWSACSQTCGLAVKFRKRICGNPAPAHGGKVCVGQEREEVFCVNNPPCPASGQSAIHGHWSSWSTWDHCSAECNGGFQTRRRRCNSPPPRGGGNECYGCSEEFRTCNEQLCPEVRKMSQWTPWRRVNRTVDGYYEERLRYGCRANVKDEGMLRIEKLKKEDRFCRDGSRTCQDSAFENIDGGWSNWSPWSYCSVSCGTGMQYRERTCDNPRPSGTGADCIGLSRMDRQCTSQPCEDSEGWSEWSDWSMCDENQEQQRKRKCNLPLSPNSYCQGSTREIRMCIPGQMASIVKNPEDGIHGGHVAGSFFLGLALGIVISFIAIYIYSKRKTNRGHHSRVATQMIPIKPNTYVSADTDWNNFPTKINSQKIPLREATIKRNGSIRTQFQTENF